MSRRRQGRPVARRTPVDEPEQGQTEQVNGDARRPRRGELRIYLGAAPGVGKTFAMLGEARRRAERGADVVVGFVETYGRNRTAELLTGLETIPRRAMSHRGHDCTEMDVAAVLARQPEI